MVELQPKTLERRVSVADASVWTFYSVQLQEKHASGGGLQTIRAAVAAVHAPCGANGEQALEVGVLAICGRSASQPRRVVFACGLACALVALLVALR